MTSLGLPWAPAAPAALPWQQPGTVAFDRDAARAKLKNYDWYREKFLCVRPMKGGERIPFIHNNAQVTLHQRLEAERAEFGMVRALIPKARRMGVSTLIGGRYFHRTATEFGRRAQVVAHRSDSATNLHREIKEFCEGLPPALRPSVSLSNARELIFDKLKSLYKVASAEGGDIGRSDDFHLLHLSEAAFFDNTEDLSSGLLQTVQPIPGTEVAMESTGNGQSGMFYNMCEEAYRQRNKGPWRLHFLPWLLMPDYRAGIGGSPPVPQGWKASQEFEEYARLHNLDRAQLHWFWHQNYTLATMNGGQPDKIHRLTRQEYPIVYSECFMADSTLDFFRASEVSTAMANKPRPSAGALKLLCVDPAGDGQDKPWVADRQGNAIGARIWGALGTRDYNTQADWLVHAFKQFNMDLIVIDVTGGYGKGLREAVQLRMGILGAEKVIGVNFAWGANNQIIYGNRRAEIHEKLAKWFAGDVSVPNDKELQEEAASYKWGQGGCRRDEKGRLFMTDKEKIRKELGRSPDKMDVCAISMAVEQ